MTLKEQLQILVSERSKPCITISLNTHRTHPDNKKDEILLKNLLKEAEDRILNEYEKTDIAPLLEKIGKIHSEIDFNYNLDSLLIFLSNDTQEIIKTASPTSNGAVYISDSFEVRELIHAVNHTEKYLLMLLSQSGVHLYEAENDSVITEITNDDFPFSENEHYNTFPDKRSDSKHLDNLVREFLNKVDKALVKVHHETAWSCVVVCTEDNYSRLLQVADKPDVYSGYATVDYHHTATHQIAPQAWAIMQKIRENRKNDAVTEMREAVGQGNVLTDLQEIYQAALDGRGELLIASRGFSQPVIMRSERTFDLSDNPLDKNAEADITNYIARELLLKNGRIVFISPEEMQDLGDIALKVRY